MKTSLLLLALFVGQPAPKTDLRFPSVTAPSVQATTKLSGSDLYVFEAKDPVIVTSSPQGLVKMTALVGPVVVRAKFVDSAGPELRTYVWKYVFMVEAQKTGPCELLVIPSGATKESEIIRKTIDVDAGQGPQPPPVPPGPTPVPPGPDPTPPPIPVAGLHVMIIEDKKQLSTMPVEQLAIRTSAEVRAWLQKNCALESTGTRAYRIWDKNTDASNSQKVWQDTLTKYRQRLPLPWIVISNGVTGYDGPLPANIAETMKLLKKYGS